VSESGNRGWRESFEESRDSVGQSAGASQVGATSRTVQQRETADDWATSTGKGETVR